MARLIRNAKDLMLPDPDTGKMSRASDPELHIRRLDHFSAGSGVDLSAINPNIGNKGLMYYPTTSLIYANGMHTGVDSIATFSTHNEGTALRTGLVQAAMNKVDNFSDKVPNPLERSAFLELLHRLPAQSHVLHRPNRADNQTFGGSVRKPINPETSPDNEEGAIVVSERSSTPRGHVDDVSEAHRRFNELTRSRRAPSRNVLDLVESTLETPDDGYLRSLQRNKPGLFSSQFLSVGNKHDEEDVIDLKTGTWAKIDPDEYFPD